MANGSEGQYRQLAAVLAQQLIRYGQHELDCASWKDTTHKHQCLDARACCPEFPCTCGLLEVLQPLMPTIKLHLPPMPPPTNTGKVLAFTRIRTTEGQQ